VSLRCAGIGAVTPHGLLAGAALRAAATGPAWPADRPARVAEFDEDAIGGARGWRRMAPVSRFALAACALALRDAGLAPEDVAGPDTALVLGTRYGSLTLFEDFHRAGPRAVSPTVFTTGVLNAPTGHASLERRWEGPTHTVVGGGAPGFEALAVAAELLAAGAARRALVVGAEEWAPLLEVGRAAAGNGAHALPTAEGAVALCLTGEGGRGATLRSVRLGSPGHRHGAARAHAALVAEALAAAATPAPAVREAWRAGGIGAGDARERAACAGLPTPHAVAPALGYAPAVTSLASVACAALAPAGAVAVATAAGGTGATGVAVWRAD
jgi:hypothetical protein